MSLGRAGHQKSGQPERTERGPGEALPEIGRDEARPARREPEGLGRADLLGQALAAANMVLAWKRVKANRGSAGADGLTIPATAAHLKAHWPRIREDLQTGRYRPQPVRRVQIPKSGGGMRELGIPTVTDRLIQQALLQVLQPLIDPTFSESSYGFRPGRRAHSAVLQAQRHVQDGYTVVVDVDLEKFFDRVNHDVLMDRRGHRFVRYADDCNVYVRSQKAGERVLAGLKKGYDRLHLRVNEAKTAVARVFGRKFLGYCLWRSAGGGVKRAVADKAIDTYKGRIRQITRRNGGCSLAEVAEELRGYLPGWKAYVQLVQTPRVFRELDEWLRHRLRAVQLKHWRRGKTMCRELLALGASHTDALRIAANSRRWWRNSRLALNRVMPIAYFDRLGVPRLS